MHIIFLQCALNSLKLLCDGITVGSLIQHNLKVGSRILPLANMIARPHMHFIMTSVTGKVGFKKMYIYIYIFVCSPVLRSTGPRRDVCSAPCVISPIPLRRS